MKTDLSKILDYLADDGTPKNTNITLAAETEKHIEEIEQRLTEKLDNIVTTALNKSVDNTPATNNTTTETATAGTATAESTTTETETNQTTETN